MAADCLARLGQQSDGSCWPFSTVAATEGIIKIKGGNLESLSVQELLDCDNKGASKGCTGGFVEDGFKFIKENGGITTEANYPYTAKDGTCNGKKGTFPTVKITGYEIVPTNSEEELLKAVAHQPVAVYIDPNRPEFQFYKSGVFTGECGTNNLNHVVVVVVGYGTTADGTKYWLLKNSWGTTWGEDGYIRLERDVEAKEGLCGIAMKPSYPVAESKIYNNGGTSYKLLTNFWQLFIMQIIFVI